MSDRIYKGRLIVTGDIADSNRGAFPEAAKEFNEPHKGGLVPFEVFRDFFTHVDSFNITVVQGVLCLSDDNVTIRVERDGTIEIVG